MKDINKIKLIWISFFSYAFTGALVVVTGMIMGDIAQYFHLSVSQMSNIFTFLNAGILISIFLNSWLIEIISLKKQIIFGFLLTIISTAGIVYSKNIFMFSINIFILGVVSGITMSIGTLIITNLYTGKERSSRLLITDSFFSMSGMVFPVIAAYLLEKKIFWYWIYICIGSIYLLIVLLTLKLKFPEVTSLLNNNQKNKNKWSMNIFFLSTSALLYILGQLSFISWVPQYVIKNIDINIQQTGSLVSNFWMSYMIGMWFFSFIIKFFNLQRVFIFLTTVSTLLMCFFIHSTNFFLSKFLIISLGFFSSAIYTIIITLASLQTRVPSPKIINFILLCGTIGTLLTFIISSPIVKAQGLYAALITANILYGIVSLLSIIIFYNTNKRKDCN